MIGETAFTVTANVDDKYTPKDKVTIIKDDTGALDEYENEYDNRDTLTTSFYVKAVTPMFEADELMVSASYSTIERQEEQREVSYKYETDAWEFDEVQHQIMDIDKDATNLQFEYIHNSGDHKIKVFGAYDKLDYSLHDYEAKSGENIPEVNSINSWGTERSDEKTITEDTQYNAKITDTYQMSDVLVLDFGVDYMNKDRSTVLTEFEVEDNVPTTTVVVDKGTYEVEQNRFDAFVEGNYEIDSMQRIGAGVRMEHTINKAAPSDGKSTEKSYTTINPSIHYLANLTENDLLRASIAQTVRRPSLDDIVPFEQEEEPRENDSLVGNPDLEPETSIGLDVGYEHIFESAGIVGVNTYYRSIKNLIEYSPTGGITTFGDENGKVYEVSNNGDAIVYGIELDINMPLTFIGVPEVSLFANYSYLDSEVTDFFTDKKRRFNDQPDYVYNFGLSHDIKNIGFSYGFNLQQRGDSTAEAADETETTEYGADLALFAQYKVAKEMVVRFTVDNALDSSVDESMTIYDSVDDKIAGIVKEYETQSETAGARYMVTLSGSF
jgi:outer membrane receptor protein involved in Fe transport